MKRREFIKYTASASALMLNSAMGLPLQKKRGKILILLELKGGNDGLNTLIPTERKNYDLYRKLRPTLTIKKSEILQLGNDWGLHPAMKKLLPLWRVKSQAIVHGVGYPHPHRSHFRSIAIYNTASSDPHATAGWIDQLMASEKRKKGCFADAVGMGSREPGPLAGNSIRRVEINSPEHFLKQSGKLHYIANNISHPMLSYLVKPTMT